MSFISEMDPPHLTLVWQTCHNFLIRTHSEDEYICTDCGAAVTGAVNLLAAPDCRPILQTRKWLPSNHPHYHAPKVACRMTTYTFGKASPLAVEEELKKLADLGQEFDKQ